MKNYIQPGDHLTLAAPEDLKSGDIFALGKIVGIAAHDGKKGEKISVAMTGVFELPKDAAEVFDVGAPVYTKGRQLTAKPEGAERVGLVVEAAAQHSSSCRVRLG